MKEYCPIMRECQSVDGQDYPCHHPLNNTDKCFYYKEQEEVMNPVPDALTEEEWQEVLSRDEEPVESN